MVNDVGKLSSVIVHQGEALGHFNELSLDNLQLVSSPHLSPTLPLCLSFPCVSIIIEPRALCLVEVGLFKNIYNINYYYYSCL